MVDISLLEVEVEKANLKAVLVEWQADREGAVPKIDFWNKYRPLWTSPTPIVL